MNIRRTAVALAAFIISTSGFNASADSADKRFRDALALYEKGMYSEARNIFDTIDDVQAEGYSVLCSVNLQEIGYENRMNAYLADSPYTGLLPKLYWQHAMNLFDAGEYEDARYFLSEIPEKKVGKRNMAEYLYKSAYSSFQMGDGEEALKLFKRTEALPMNDYTAPSRYAIGYINYEDENFSEALSWFEKSVKDPRFEEVSNYYIMECHFMQKDYSYVTSHGDEMYDRIPEERKPHLARIISESYLVKGQPEKARQYYELTNMSDGKTRGDLFYAGTLLYSVKDYRGAIENYSKMTDRSDSLGQMANYNMGYSYIQTKNKVEALNAFKAASEVDHDPKITEDAFYNYAKLSFDLNDDNSVFNRYLDRYSNKVKGDQIYEYQALAALYDRDYASAVAAYDKIDELGKDMVGNYMKANYLRAEQLISAGSWRNAVAPLKAASYYSDKRSFFNQLSRYWLAESYYRNDQYDLARTAFTELYNASALDGQPEGSLIPFDLAYCYYKEDNYEAAIKWFDEYLKGGDLAQRFDALQRKGDSYFAMKQYGKAASAYEEAAKLDKNDLYPAFQAGISYGLAGDRAKKMTSLSAVNGAKPSSNYYDDACFELGRTYVEAGDPKTAATYFKKIVDAGNSQAFVARSLVELGTIERNARNYDEALRNYKKVVSDMPGSEYANDALLAIELIYQAKGEPEGYVAYVESMGDSAVTVDIDKEELLFNAAEQIYLSGNWQKALASLENYQQRYPTGKHFGQSNFYIAEAYRGLDRKEQAVDFYQKVLDGKDDSFKETAALSAARLSSEIENFDDAYTYFQKLASVAKLDQNKHTANMGMMESAFMAKKYASAIDCADIVRDDTASSDDDRLEAVYVKAKSYLATSNRDMAMTLLKSIASKTDTPQGAEAAYLLIQDCSDQGSFEEVETRVFALAESGCDQNYWLAKSFILLGDSYVERGEFKQARATYESVKGGYESSGTGDDVLDNVNIRLQKLDQMGK